MSLSLPETGLFCDFSQFETLLLCAVRDALTRSIYAPNDVVSFLSSPSLISNLSDAVLLNIRSLISNRRSYNDPHFDVWETLLFSLDNEAALRRLV